MDTMVNVGRIHDDVDPRAGKRILVDRLWPRGVSKEAAALDRWCKEVSPSDDLRRWYDHVEERFEEFSHRYDQQLCDEPRPGLVNELAAAAQAGPILLLTATKDVAHSHVPILVRAIARVDDGVAADVDADVDADVAADVDADVDDDVNDGVAADVDDGD